MSRPEVEPGGHPFTDREISRSSSCVIGADVGGTYARLAWAELGPGAAPQLRDFRKYTCAEHESLAAILRDYLQQVGQHAEAPALTQAVIAIPGIIDGDSVLNVNLPWPVSVAATRQDAGLDRLELINDFVAVAQAMPPAEPGSLQLVCGDPEANTHGPAVVLGPGTGLGVAVRLIGGHPSVLPSEAGHATLSASTPLEQDVLRRLSQQYDYVDHERVLSGPGLMTLYACLCELRGQAQRWLAPDALVQAGRNGDALAAECLQVFCAWLGSFAGDLALTFGARSVYLTGGVTGHLAVELHGGAFEQRFRAKGGLSPAVAHTPVWRVEHGELGVLGALSWHAEQHARD